MGGPAENYYTGVESSLHEYAPTLNERGSHWWIQIATESEWFPGAGQSFLGLQFKRTVTQEQAEEFERLFDRMVEGLSLTRFR
jgi:hypothetical protein